MVWIKQGSEQFGEKVLLQPLCCPVRKMLFTTYFTNMISTKPNHFSIMLTVCQNWCECLSQISSLYCEERGKAEWRSVAGGLQDGGTIQAQSQLKEMICTIFWKRYLSGWMVLSKPNRHGGAWFKWRGELQSRRDVGCESFLSWTLSR